MTRKKGSLASPISVKIKEKFGMTLAGYAKDRGLHLQMLSHLINGTGGKVYGPNGIGHYGKIADQLKADGVWIEPKK